MVLSQVGGGVYTSRFTVLGGILGALTYGLLENGIKNRWLSKGPMGPTGKFYADVLVGRPFWHFGIPLGAACVTFAILLERLVEWKADLPVRLVVPLSEDVCGESFDALLCPAWPPSVAGLFLGTLQVPAVLLVGTALGSSTSYMVVASAWAIPFRSMVKTRWPYIAHFATPHLKTWWQLLYCGFAVVGARLVLDAAGDVGGAPGVDAISATVGGFFMIFGSRLASGCTSGHGITGCGLVRLQSFIAVPAMFGGGILTALAWNVYTKGGFA